MDDARLAAFVRSQINDAIGYDQTELSLRRVKAIEYYRGELRDLDARDGWSKVTTRDLSDHIGWILPSLMRVFASSDKVVCYEPEGPEDEGVDKQASDYVNYIFWRECSGYRVLWDAFQDALMFGNGVFKFWWDAAPKYEILDYSGLSDEAFTQLVADDEVTVLQHSEEIKTETVLTRKPAIQLQCKFFCKIQGKDTNTGKDVEEWNCSIAFLPLLLIENSGQQRQTGAAVESFRNEMVKANETSQQALLAHVQASTKLLDS